jgi:uncharacterized membrane protein YuzA (DUF378 family)
MEAFFSEDRLFYTYTEHIHARKVEWMVHHRRHSMKTLNLITLILIIVGGLNWGLVGVANFDLVAAIFGEGSLLSRLVYALVGLSALYQIMPLLKAFELDEPRAEAARR